MKVATVKFVSSSPIVFAKYTTVDRLDRESDADYADRIWREKLHYNPETEEAYIPANAIKKCIQESAKFLSMKIPGKGKNTYTKHFDAGITVADPINLGVFKNQVKRLSLYLPSDGKVGGSTRVQKDFPKIDKWEGTTDIFILDEIITEKVLYEHLKAAGMFIGLLAFRPRKREDKGRFSAEILSWKDWYA